MRLALCGNPTIAQQLQASSETGDVELKFFVCDFVSTSEVNIPANFLPISFFEFRRLISYGELDGLIIADTPVYGNFKDNFVVFMTLHGSNDPEKSRVACLSDICRFLRDGKIYKCQNEALRFRFAEKFGIEGLPEPAGIDLNAPNFSLLLDMLDGSVEMCHWCSEQAREIPWQPTNNPKLEDWLADPDELKNFM